MTSYLRCPFAVDRSSFAETDRYRHLAETIMDLGQATSAGARPRSLRCRHDIAARFDRDAFEIRALGSTLETAMTRLVEQLMHNRGNGGVGPGQIREAKCDSEQDC